MTFDGLLNLPLQVPDKSVVESRELSPRGVTANNMLDQRQEKEGKTA